MTPGNTPVPAVGMAQRASGLIVPANLAHEAPPDAKPAATIAFDLDGRRRVVLSNETKRLVNRLIRELRPHGIGILVGCRPDVPRVDGLKPCGQLMEGEGLDTGDAGLGCQCSRIHYLP